MSLFIPNDFLAFESASRKLESLVDAFRGAVKRVVNEDSSEFSATLDDFESNIPTILLTDTLGTELESLFINFEDVAANSRDQYLLAVELFDFGDDDTQTNNTPIQASNNEVINSAVQINSLSLAYNSAVLIEYVSEQDLDEVKDTLDTQYQKDIAFDVNSDTRVSLLQIRTDSNRFFSQLDLKSVVDIETTQIPSTVLSYQYNGTSSDADSIITLNEEINTGFIEGTVKVLSE